MSMKLSINIISDNGEYIASCPELDINCYGSDKKEAVRRIQNVIRFYIDSAKEMGYNVDDFDKITFAGDGSTFAASNSTPGLNDTVH